MESPNLFGPAPRQWHQGWYTHFREVYTTMSTKNLTNSAIKMLKPRDKKYMVADGERLFIMVMPLTGTQTECTKRWVSRVRFQGRDLDIGLGLCPEV